MPPKYKNTGADIASLWRSAGSAAKRSAENREQGLSDDPSLTIPLPKGPQAYKPKIFNILEYIESSWGLGMRLFPAQRFLVKLYYHLPLEEKEKTITLTDMFNTKVLNTFTEKEYLKFLFNEGRCNIGEQDHERRELVLAIGRRAGKTTLSGIFASYEVYRLLNLHNPQEYYGLPNGNRIQIISIATDKDQAGILFNEVSTHLAKCDYFKPFTGNNTQSFINFRTPYDIDKYGPTTRHQDGKFVSFAGKATLRVTFKSCIAKGLRGAGNIIVILDEVAHFQDKGQSSAEEIYNAVTPSIAAFSPKDPNTGMPIYGPQTDTEARVILISSPLNRTGKFFELFHLAMSRQPGSENLLAIQAPTWEINPTVPSSYYRSKFHADANVFMTEHGAQFSDRVKAWLSPEDVMPCVDDGLRPKELGFPRWPHFMGIDVGLMKDGTAIFITHIEGGRIVLDYHELWQAGVDWKESNPHLDIKLASDYAKNLKTVERLDFDEIATWITALTKRFHIEAGLFDRWNGIPLEQALNKRGLSQFKSEYFSRDMSSKMFQAVKLNLLDKKLSLYDWPKPQGSVHSPFIKEILDLQAEQVSKNLVIVAAPDAAGYHDDMSDAFVRSVWLASEHMASEKHAFGGNLYPRQSAGPSQMGYQMRRMRSHGAFTERMSPRSGLGRRLGLRGGR